jgi:hypothetical protein
LAGREEECLQLIGGLGSHVGGSLRQAGGESLSFGTERCRLANEKEWLVETAELWCATGRHHSGLEASVSGL